MPEPDATTPPALAIVALDDDPDFREYIQSLLQGDGHDVRVVATPEALYTTCQERLPEVLLLDMMMGRDSGEDVLKHVRARWPRLCVIVVTGYPSLDSMRETFRQDVFDYLAKPFSVVELRRTLAQAAQRLGLGGAPPDRLRRELGRQVRIARTERGWTLKELSDASGVSVSQLSSIERAAHLPSMESLLAIANALERRASDWIAQAGF